METPRNHPQASAEHIYSVASNGEANGAYQAAIQGYPTETSTAVPVVATPSAPQRTTSDGPRKPGPGRKSRACIECKKQKMKCDVPPGHRKCRHCLKRGVECSLQFKKPTLPSSQQKSSEGSFMYDMNHEQKLDSLQQELHQVRSTLDKLVARGAFITVPSKDGYLDVTATPQSNAAAIVRSDLSNREDNMQMAMTRENSLEPDSGSGGENYHNGMNAQRLAKASQSREDLELRALR